MGELTKLRAEIRKLHHLLERAEEARKLAVLDEREACAKVAESAGGDGVAGDTAADIAFNIRHRAGTAHFGDYYGRKK